MPDKKEYLVRGAKLFCDKGCRIKKLELPKDHGVYTKETLPMVHLKDKEVGKHIPEGSFGICTGDCPAGDKVMVQELYDEHGEVVGQGEEITGPACEAVIAESWKVPVDTLFIYDGGYKKAVTTDSFLVCKYGGIITVLSSGQEDG